jgi:general secretion pathway protein D
MKQVLSILAFFGSLSILANESTTPEDKPVEKPDEYQILAQNLVAESKADMDCIYYQCKNVKASAMKSVLENFISSQGSVAGNDDTNMITIWDVKSRHEILKKIASSNDANIPQVLVQARIVEFTVDSDFEKEVSLALKQTSTDKDGFLAKQLGSVLGTPGANPNSGRGGIGDVVPWRNSSGGTQTDLNLFLRYLETKSKARILSAPNLIVMQGCEGTINTGEEVPILTQTVTSGAVSTSTEFKSVGIKLRVKADLIGKTKARLIVTPEVSTVTGFSNAGGGVANPIIAIRNADTTAQLYNDQICHIAGLIREEDRKIESRTPYLSSIPLLGWLFTSERTQKVQTKMVIFFTMNILDENESAAESITKPILEDKLLEKLKNDQEEIYAPKDQKEDESDTKLKNDKNAE